ncbi:MAG: ATP-binding cassette domain-containing protein [Ignavibacteriales bacterium]|nr:ATP-binding cassette domain-containing protein [Ignavibacteriales bacterium]HOJ17984.1 ATP-binding cassette domain-containing protein [Ignavibacteriaceae bacterium]HPO54909.1 ATP-binding cassette domain-containing protein [Ignavibacteriaceae bacterium]
MIQLSNINKIFNPGTVNEVKALTNINLEVNNGDFVTIIGTNGSGKTTLLNLITGSFFPDTGIISIDGKNVTREKDYKRARYISRVFQNPYSGSAPKMTIAENLLIAYTRNGHRNPVISLTSKLRNYFREQVAMLEMQLEDRLDNVVGMLSGGQRQAVTLLMAVLKSPKVLLLDEHTAALDPKSAAQVISLTKRMIEEKNLTAIMITHSMQQALDLGNRTLMLYKGEIIDDISANEKRRLTVDDLLGKFSDLRKREKLTEDVLTKLKSEYI